MYAKNGRGGPTEPFDLPPVLLEQGEDLVRTLGSLRRGVFDAGQKELQPGLPISGRPNSIEEFVIALAVRLKVETQVQNRLPDRAGGTQQKRDEQAAQST